VKKLLFVGCVAVACAAMADEEEKSAQVYDLTITVKTTTAKSGKLSTSSNKFLTESGTVVYRTQSTSKWKGLVWGCDCNSLAGKWQLVDADAGTVAGCVIWDSKQNDVLFIEDLNWRLLNAIDKNGDKCEGSFTIGNMDDASEAFLAFAGFGSLSVDYSASPCEDPEVHCTSYVKQMSGNVAGWMPAPTLTTGGRTGSCTFCGTYDPGEDPTTDMATAWNFCPCEEYADLEHTAVSGSWSLKYNSKASKKLKKSATIVDVVSLPSNVKLKVEQKMFSMQ